MNDAFGKVISTLRIKFFFMYVSDNFDKFHLYYFFSDGMKLRGGKTKIEYPDSPNRDAKSKAVYISLIDSSSF